MSVRMTGITASSNVRSDMPLSDAESIILKESRVAGAGKPKKFASNHLRVN